MRALAWRKTVGVLLCGTFMVLMAAGPATAADDKMLDELKARLDKLEKQNEELRSKLSGPAVAPYQAAPAEATPITKIVDDYLKEKDAKKKAEDDLKKSATEAEKAAKEEEGYKVGSDLGIKVRWNYQQGLMFETEKKDFVSHLGFFMMWDTVSWTQSPALRAPSQLGDLQDGTFFRRIRPLYDGRTWDFVEWNVILALEQVQGTLTGGAINTTTTPNTVNGVVNSNINMDEVWAGVYGLPIIGRLRAGHLKVCQGLEGNQWSSSRCMTFQENAAYTDAFYNIFATGIQQCNSGWCGPYGDRFTWQSMVYRDDNPRSNDVEDFGDGDYGATARVTALLIDECEDRHFLHVGASATWRKAQRTGNDLGGAEPVVQFRARPELRDSIGGFDGAPGGGVWPGNNNRLVDTGAIAANSATVIGTELWYNLGPFNVMAEWAVASMDNAVVPVTVGGKVTNINGDRTFHGGYVTVSYFLTGESEVYDHTFGRRGFTYIDRPFTNFWATWDESHGISMGLGAWEVAARYSYLNLNDGPVRGGVMQGMTLGLNWYLNNNLKVQFEYLTDQRWDKASGASGNIPGTVQGFGTRMMIQF